MRSAVPVALLTGAMALAATLTGVTAAHAQGRPCGQPVSASGVGSLGTPWTLKSMYDDDGPVAHPLVAGEEFEIITQAGQHWSVTFSDNGVVFFSNPDDVSTATGIREVHPNPVVAGRPNHMAVHAVRADTGEVIDGFVDLAPPPATCGR